MQPLIGISCDVALPDPQQPSKLRVFSPIAYQDAVARAGGLPVLLSPQIELVDAYLDRLDGLLLTGGDDVDVRALNAELHPKANVMHPRRQAFELALLAAVDRRRELPTLGICLGMQLMAVHHAGPSALVQHLPDEPGHDEQSAARHARDFVHQIRPTGAESRHRITPGPVASWHHQAVRAGVPLGPLVVTMVADDGTVEAIEDRERPFYLGVQWHPERTSDEHTGMGVIRRLVQAAAARLPN